MILLILVAIVLFLMAIIDFEYEEIPHTLTIILLALGIYNIAINAEVWYMPLIYALVSFILFFVLYIFSNIGGGDVKVLAISMLFLNDINYLAVYCVLFSIAVFSGMIFMFINHKKSLRLAPYMSAGLLSTLVLMYSENFNYMFLSVSLLIIFIVLLDITLFRKEHILNETLFKR